MAVMENGGKGMGIGLSPSLGLMNFSRMASDVDPSARYENPSSSVFIQLENVRIPQTFEQNAQKNVQESAPKPEQSSVQNILQHENNLPINYDNVNDNVSGNVHENIDRNVQDNASQILLENVRQSDEHGSEQNLQQNKHQSVQNLQQNACNNSQHNSEQMLHKSENGLAVQENGKPPQELNRNMRELVDLLSKLNPLAKEFVPLSLAVRGSPSLFSSPGISSSSSSSGGSNNNNNNRRKKINSNQGKRRLNSRTSRAQREDSIRRTVYVSDIDQQVTEEQLAALFINCGQVVDCRVCGDPNSVLRFAFVEFTDESSARAALSLAGTMLGYYPVRVLPSKTAIAPVNPTFLPRTEEEREMCARTIYCTNIDKKVSQSDLKAFFETLCGEVSRLRLLGDFHHSTRIAFVEFILAESAMAALNCSGSILGSLPIRVSPSKTPVRPRSPRPTIQ
jgi:RNA recognition motif-containing protein